MQPAPHSPTTAAKSRRALGAALGLVLLAGAAPFLSPANAAQPTSDPLAAAETAIESGVNALDPAIWVNPTDATGSLILGANDSRLVTYDMTGAIVEQDGVPAGTTAGKVSGVDVRHDVMVGGRAAGDIAVTVGDDPAANNAIVGFYAIDRATGLLEDVAGTAGGIKTPWHSGSVSDVCMYQSPVSNKTYAFVMSKNGEMVQYELIDSTGKIGLTLVRGGTTSATVWDVAATGSTLSGCVADDGMQALYVSDTETGIVKFAAEPGATPAAGREAGTVIDTPAPGHLLPKAKGPAIVETGEGTGYLIASTLDTTDSAAIHSFNVYDRAEGNAFIRSFQVLDGATADRCEGTERIEAAMGNFGPGFTAGLFVCQDKKNRPATGGSFVEHNFKMVPLDAVVDLTVVTTTTTVPPAETTTTTAPVQIPNDNRSGYWMVGSDGKVYEFGDAKHHGNIDLPAGAQAVDLEPTPSGNGYWVIDDLGHVFAKGDAKHFGDVTRSALPSTDVITSLSATKSGNGYWVFTSSGRALPFGGAVWHGDMRDAKLNGPVLDSIATSSGNGYYMVGSDGGIFSFGDAKFYGSMGDKKLNAPVQSLVPDSDGIGYWLVASDGGIFAFEAQFRGSMGAIKLNKPVTGMVRYGNGYLMVGEDGGIFSFSDKEFVGSLGNKPPLRPITSVAVLDAP
jgi:myo-inositol-hexaphosphate 3-phosphohydrolase